MDKYNAVNFKRNNKESIKHGIVYETKYRLT